MNFLPLALIIHFLASDFFERRLRVEKSFFYICYILIFPLVGLLSYVFKTESFSLFELIHPSSFIELCLSVVLPIGLYRNKNNQTLRMLALSILLLVVTDKIAFLSLSILTTFYVLKELLRRSTYVLIIVASVLVFLISSNLVPLYFKDVTNTSFFLMLLFLHSRAIRTEVNFEYYIVLSLILSKLFLIFSFPVWAKFLSMIALLGLIFILVVNILRRKSERLEEYSKLFLVFITILPILDLWILYVGTILIIVIINAINKLGVKTDVFQESLIGFTLFFSPPLGLGYILKTEMLESAISISNTLIFPLLAIMVLLQGTAIKMFWNSLKPNIEDIKNKKLSLGSSIIANLFIVFGISILFIPSKWNNQFGELFYNVFQDGDPQITRIHIGNFLFWIEFFVWGFVFYIVYKFSDLKIEKLYLKIINTNSNRVTKKYSVSNEDKNIGSASFTELLLAFGKGQVLDTEKFSLLIMLFVLILLMIGLG